MRLSDLDERLPVPSPTVIYRSVGDGAVLLSSADEVYYGLNRVGARIWELLPPVTQSLTDLCEALHRDYPQVELSTLQRDALELLRDLVANGLAVPAGAERAA